MFTCVNTSPTVSATDYQLSLFVHMFCSIGLLYVLCALCFLGDSSQPLCCFWILGCFDFMLDKCNFPLDGHLVQLETSSQQQTFWSGTENQINDCELQLLEQNHMNGSEHAAPLAWEIVEDFRHGCTENQRVKTKILMHAVFNISESQIH